ncbi:MAG: preprotein translocase subunit SecE [Dehalococcoidia bacterium]|nr:preprotein translocase subunit SecE [Dehalococcoidia bacterium]
MGGERPKLNLPGVRFFQDIIAELKRVVWPTRQDAMRMSMMVIIVSVAVGLALGVVDYIFTVVVDRILIGGA